MMTWGCLYPNVDWKIFLQQRPEVMLFVYCTCIYLLSGMLYTLYKQSRDVGVIKQRDAGNIITNTGFCVWIIKVSFWRIAVVLEWIIFRMLHLRSRLLYWISKEREHCALLSVQTKPSSPQACSLFTSRWSQLTFNLCTPQTGPDMLMTHAYGWEFADNQRGKYEEQCSAGFGLNLP